MKNFLLFLAFCCVTRQSAFGQVSFQDISAQAGLTQIGLNYGAAMGDFNNDDLEDIFATRLMDGGMLYQNLGNGNFANITAQSGISTLPSAQFAVWGDVNNDGWLDLFIGARDEGNALYLNNQDGTFTDVAALAGVATGTKVKAVLFADVDMDGWLDIYIARLGLQNILYRNNGSAAGAGLSFTDITLVSGATDPLISMGAVFFDYDNDGDPDLYLTHDANIPNILYRNNGNGTFSDVSIISGTNIAAMGMGVDVGDINNDGWLDIYITNLGPNTLLLNNGNGTFFNIANLAGVADVGMGWGCSFLDFDNDGWQDIYVANDSYFSPYPNLLYRNNGNPTALGTTFTIVSMNSPLHSMEGGYGLSCFDYDDDGKLDIYLANYSGSIGNQLFKNNNDNSNNWLKVKTIGVESNRTGIGAKVKLNFGNHMLVDEVSGGSGWASQNSLVQHFGLGTSNVVDLVTVRWPSGIIDSFVNVGANQLLVVTEGESEIITIDPDPDPDPDPGPGPIPNPDTLAWIPHFKGNLPVEFEEPNAVNEGNLNGQTVWVSPNPFSQFLQIQLNGILKSNTLKIKFLDATGRLFYVPFVFNTVGEDTSIWADTSSLPRGIYFVHLIYDREVFNKTVVKI